MYALYSSYFKTLPLFTPNNKDIWQFMQTRYEKPGDCWNSDCWVYFVDLFFCQVGVKHKLLCSSYKLIWKTQVVKMNTAAGLIQ